MQPSGGALPTIVFAVLVLFALYRRFRRTVGRQKVTTKRFLFRIVLLGVGGCALLASLLAGGVGPMPLLYALVGLGVGAGVAIYGLRLTEFERTRQEEGGEKVYFTPNLYIGLAVSTLFVGRLLYRFVFHPLSSSAPSSGASQPFGPPSLGSPPGTGGGVALGQAFDPVTLVILFVIFGYYIFYYLGVLRRSRELAAEST